MSTQTGKTTDHRPEWIRKASEAIADMYQRGVADAVRDKAEMRAGAEHAGVALHAKADSARTAMQAGAEKTRATLSQDAANAKEKVRETQEKIADIIHRHFEQKK